jgi:NTP pyrophosphatase (non-canonical NTP hydrolase)
MTFGEYQLVAHSTAIWPEDLGELEQSRNIYYPILGLAGEAGELAGKASKIMRDKQGILDQETRDDLVKELGDCCWFLAEVATVLGVTLESVFEGNAKKLLARKEKGTLGGSGDNR